MTINCPKRVLRWTPIPSQTYLFPLLGIFRVQLTSNHENYLLLPWLDNFDLRQINRIENKIFSFLFLYKYVVDNRHFFVFS